MCACALLSSQRVTLDKERMYVAYFKGLITCNEMIYDNMYVYIEYDVCGNLAIMQ